MASTASRRFPCPPRRISYGAKFPPRVSRRYARAIADAFHPELFILFRSHACGTPHDDSDVDLLVVMPTRNAHAQAGRGRNVCRPRLGLEPPRRRERR